MLNLFNKKTKNSFISPTTKFDLINTEPNYITLPPLTAGEENEKKENLGVIAHYPPATKEWPNSIYSYNKNFTKTLPAADNVVNALVKSYFNLTPLFKQKKSTRLQVRLKRLSLNRIMVSKAEIKHTNNKVIITVYLYNRNKKYLFHNLSELYKKLLFKTKKQFVIRKMANKIVKPSDLNNNYSLNKIRSYLSKPKSVNTNVSKNNIKPRTVWISKIETENKNKLKFSSKRSKPRNKQEIIKINTNNYANFTKLTMKNLSKFISNIKQIKLKNNYKTLITNIYSELNKYKFYANRSKDYLNLINLSTPTTPHSEENKNIYTTYFYKVIKANSKLFAFKTKRSNSNTKLINKTRKDRKIKNFMFKLRKFYNLFWLSETYNSSKINSTHKDNFLLKNMYRLLKTSQTSKAQKKIDKIWVKGIKILKKARKHKSFLLRILKWNKKTFAKYEALYYKRFIKKAYRKEKLYLYYARMLTVNNNKFKNWFLLGLKQTISKLYNKNIEFNFVNLKYVHLSSDIFSSSIETKLRNRENRLIRVLKKALNLVKLPTTSKFSYSDVADNKANKVFIARSKTLNINTFASGTKIKDTLHNLLYTAYPTSESYSGFSNYLRRNIIDSLKYKTVYGVRLEAAGRLSRRLTASRSVFKLKYKGSIKNIDSSNKGLSSVMLRGIAKPNQQFTKLESKTRNGSFGLKGWISGG